MLIIGCDEVNSKPPHAKPTCAGPGSVRAGCLCAAAYLVLRCFLP